MSRLGAPSTRHQDGITPLSSTSTMRGWQGLRSTSALTLYQHRWNASINWSSSSAKADLLTMYDKRETVSSTLWAMALTGKGFQQFVTQTTGTPSHQLPTSRSPIHAANMRALMADERPPNLSSASAQTVPAQPTSKQPEHHQQCLPHSKQLLWVRPGQAMTSQHTWTSHAGQRGLRMLPCAHLQNMPISRMACRHALEAVHNKIRASQSRLGTSIMSVRSLEQTCLQPTSSVSPHPVQNW